MMRSEIIVGEWVSKLSDDRAGALASFEGRVRNHHLGRRVTALEYEAAPRLAKNEFAQICNEAKEKLDILDVLCAHRLGHLRVGETAIWLGVLAAHRADAFKACERIMHELKLRLPIWKKEFYEDGASLWIEDPCGCVH